jgi:RNA polymerase sigma-B factor
MNDRPMSSVRECLARALADDRRLVRRHRRGDPRAREILVERYLPLARNLALRYRLRGEPPDDLIQVAAVGLLKAADRWDPERGAPFASYAAPTIVGELRHHFRDATWVVRPPRELQQLCLSVQEAQKTLSTELGREPTLADLSGRLDRPPAKIQSAIEAAAGRFASPLDAPVAEGEKVTAGELIAFPDPGYDRAEARITVEQLMRPLDFRTREILLMRFEQDLTQAEIARRVGVSQMHVSRIIRSALQKLSAPTAASTSRARAA